MKRTRRETLRSAARAAVGGALGVLGIALATRFDRHPARRSCDRHGLCGSCRYAADCVRPEAASYRETHP